MRQVLALMEYPQLIKTIPDAFPSDVLERVKVLMKSVGSTGAYSHSQGIPAIRDAVARYIEQRDGFSSSSKQIFLTNGASDGVHRALACIISSANVGVMIPVPQYPLYSAAITLLNGVAVPYYLDENQGWSLTVTAFALKPIL